MSGNSENRSGCLEMQIVHRRAFNICIEVLLHIQLSRGSRLPIVKRIAEKLVTLQSNTRKNDKRRTARKAQRYRME